MVLGLQLMIVSILTLSNKWLKDMFTQKWEFSYYLLTFMLMGGFKCCGVFMLQFEPSFSLQSHEPAAVQSGAGCLLRHIQIAPISRLHFTWCSATNLPSVKLIRWTILELCWSQTDRKRFLVLWLDNGTWGKVRMSPKPLSSFGNHDCLDQNVMAIHPVVEIIKFGSKGCIDISIWRH